MPFRDPDATTYNLPEFHDHCNTPEHERDVSSATLLKFAMMATHPDPDVPH